MQEVGCRARPALSPRRMLPTDVNSAQDHPLGYDQRYGDLIKTLGVAAYVTDAAGYITAFNDAAVELWGRRPELGNDRWSGAWKLYRADGTPMPHDEAPLAVALKEGVPIRGDEAIAERPDGTRTFFLPFPTPVHDASGKLVGAVNVLVDISERKRAEEETTRLLASEQEARANMETAQQKLWFLSEATGTLVSSLNLDTTLATVARLAVPFLADCCAAHILATEDTEARSSIAHIDESKEELVREIQRRYAPRPGDEHPVTKMMETERSVLVREIDDEQVRRIAQGNGHLALLAITKDRQLRFIINPEFTHGTGEQTGILHTAGPQFFSVQCHNNVADHHVRIGRLGVGINPRDAIA